MTALEKTAWTELLVSISAIVVVLLLVPWYGVHAHGGFGMLGLLGFTVIWLRKRSSQSVTIDERDREIDRKARLVGISTAWMLLFTGVAAATLWSGRHDVAVPTPFLVWLVWIQFAVCYAVKGLVGVLMYRSYRGAA